MMKKFFAISLLFIFGFIALAPETLAHHGGRRIYYRSNYSPAYYNTAYGNNCSRGYRSYRSTYYTTGYRTYGYPTYVRSYRSYGYPTYVRSYRSYSYPTYVRSYGTPYYRVAGSRYTNSYYRRHSRTRALLTIGAPAAIGAGIGALLGGGKGAGIGALLGGGGGAAYYLTKRHRRY
jgi:hypothetical protein